MGTVESGRRLASPASTPGTAAGPVTAPACVEAEIPRMLVRDVRRLTRRIAKRVLILAALLAVGILSAISGYFTVPIVLVVYFACGLLDVMRNSPRNLFTIDNYFFGNGTSAWLLSPFNLLMDVIALPYWNKGVYQLEDLPGPIQDEINDLIKSSHESDVIEQLESRIGDGRSMIFFKWYGKNFDDTLMHRSCNETDAVRFCMFIDIVRPSYCPPLARAIVTGLQHILVRMRFVFYKRWAEIR